ncbi:hypothetical protein EVB27_056 [Rhizobium phage RHph_TM16]|nr:hypothetical protein EVB27_056 [Rhizobium phage RHph_TM16]
MAELYNKLERFRKELIRRGKGGNESIEIREVHAKIKKMLDDEIAPTRTRTNYALKYGLPKGPPPRED